MKSDASPTPGPRRLNRPKDKDDLLVRLTEDGPFGEYRDVLVFAAAFGFLEGNRAPFTDRGEAIRWETAANRRGTETLVNMIAAAEVDDPEILADSRFDERLEIFEEYANGGLERLRVLLERNPRAPTDIILELVQRAAKAGVPIEGVDLAGAANDLDWS